MEGWVSSRLGIRFERGHKADPVAYEIEGNRFVGFVELRQALEAAIERERREEEQRRAEQERLLREQAERRLAELEAELRRLRDE
jgi:hypothetical protein